MDGLLCQIQQILHKEEHDKNQVVAYNRDTNDDLEKMRGFMSNKDNEIRRLRYRVEEVLASKRQVQTEMKAMRRHMREMEQERQRMNASSRQIEVASSVMEKVITNCSNEGVIKEEAGAGRSAMDQEWADMPSVAKKMTQLAEKLRKLF